MKVLRADRCQCCNTLLDIDAHNIFDENGKAQNLAGLLHDNIGKQLDERDGINYAICDSCWQQLLQCHAFKQKCMQANAIATDNNFLTLDNRLTEYAADGIVIEYLDDPDSQNDLNNDHIANDDGGCAANGILSTNSISALVKPMTCNKFTDYLRDIANIKRKAKFGIPYHTERHFESNNLDVYKILSSDDLVHILEDNYHNEQMQFGINGSDDGEMVNMDQYLISIASISYDESFKPCIRCALCPEEIKSQHNLVCHTKDCHMNDGGFSCIMDENCCIFNDLTTVQKHIFEEHIDSLPTQFQLTCTTCDNTFKSSVDFGKHMCLILDDEPTDFQCVTCEKRLSSRKRYLFHTQFHLDNARPKVCIVCELQFHTEEAFYNHVMFLHEPNLEHFCRHCDSVFGSKLNLDEHLQMRHTKPPAHCLLGDTNGSANSVSDENADEKSVEKSLTCPICKKSYNRMSRLRKHMTTHEQFEKSSVLVCDPCSMAFATLEDVDYHCIHQHDEDIANIIEKEILFVVCCEYCEFAFTDHTKLLKHKECHAHDDKPFKCEFCMATYETYSKLKTHKNTHIHQQIKFPVQRQYLCDIEECWKRYRHWSDLSIHRKTVHLINPTVYKCQQCEQTFHHSWKFSYHKKTVHAIASVKCSVCGMECANAYNLRHHRKKCGSEDTAKQLAKPKQSKSKTFDMAHYIDQIGQMMKCRLCDKQLATRITARIHVEMTHLKIRRHRCDTCGKEFYLRKDYMDHLRLHTFELPYECKICLKKFRTTSAVSDHRRNHSNERPYSCPYCESTFKRAYVLKNHIKQHIGVKGFPCSIADCKKEYRTQWELNNHCRTKHRSDIARQGAKDKSVAELPVAEQVKIEYKKPTPPKTRNKQKIIYVLPGPQSNYSSNEHIPFDRNICFDTQTIVKTSQVDHNYIRTNEAPVVTNDNAKGFCSRDQSFLTNDIHRNN